MKQLGLRDGDLALGQGGFVMVTGAERIRQDLGAAIREAIGTDRFHPGWGTIVQDYVGGQQDDETYMLVQSEIARVIQNYIVMQADQIAKDADAGMRSRFTPSEIITSVGAIDIQQRMDQIAVRVTVGTSDGGRMEVIRSVEMG